MSHRDVLKSLLHRAAVGASSTSAQVMRSRWAQELRHRLGNVYPFRATLTDEDLGRAVGRAAHIAAATVRIQTHGITLHLEDHEGHAWMLELRPAGVSFAPRGAKELAFLVMPAEAAMHGHTLDACAAVAGEIARALWQPVLTSSEQDVPQTAQVNRVGDQVFADLRSIPAVRRAQANPFTGNLIDALSLADIRLHQGRMVLTLALPNV